MSPARRSPGSPPGITAGATHAGDAVAAQAQADLGIAYDDAAGRAPTASVAGDLVGVTLPTGVYKSTSTLAVSGVLTLDGQGDPNSVFIFQVASGLTTASASSIRAINGAQACHVFWQIGTSATLGTGSRFTGTIMAMASISVTTGTVVVGRALARTGQVSLDTNTFTMPACNTTTTTAGVTTTAAPTSTTAADTSTSAGATSTTAAATTTTAAATTTIAGATTTLAGATTTLRGCDDHSSRVRRPLSPGPRAHSPARLPPRALRSPPSPASRRHCRRDLHHLDEPRHPGAARRGVHDDTHRRRGDGGVDGSGPTDVDDLALDLVIDDRRCPSGAHAEWDPVRGAAGAPQDRRGPGARVAGILGLVLIGLGRLLQVIGRDRSLRSRGISGASS